MLILTDPTNFILSYPIFRHNEYTYVKKNHKNQDKRNQYYRHWIEFKKRISVIYYYDYPILISKDIQKSYLILRGVSFHCTIS